MALSWFCACITNRIFRPETEEEMKKKVGGTIAGKGVAVMFFTVRNGKYRPQTHNWLVNPQLIVRLLEAPSLPESNFRVRGEPVTNLPRLKGLYLVLCGEERSCEGERVEEKPLDPSVVSHSRMISSPNSTFQLLITVMVHSANDLFSNSKFMHQ